MHWAVAIAIALLAGGTVVRLALAWMNVRHTRRAVDAHAGWIREQLGVDEPAAIAGYLTARTRAGAVSTLLTTAAVIAVLATGTLGAAIRWLDGGRRAAPWGAARSPSPRAAGGSRSKDRWAYPAHSASRGGWACTCCCDKTPAPAEREPTS